MYSVHCLGYVHTYAALRCDSAALWQRCAALVAALRCAIASSAQCSDNYLDYRSAAQRSAAYVWTYPYNRENMTASLRLHWHYDKQMSTDHRGHIKIHACREVKILKFGVQPHVILWLYNTAVDITQASLTRLATVRRGRHSGQPHTSSQCTMRTSLRPASQV